jgi:hypothetical protein
MGGDFPHVHVTGFRLVQVTDFQTQFLDPDGRGEIKHSFRLIDTSLKSLHEYNRL